MYIAMNRFKIIKGRKLTLKNMETKRLISRGVEGLENFIVRGISDFTLYASHACRNLKMHF